MQSFIQYMLFPNASLSFHFSQFWNGPGPLQKFSIKKIQFQNPSVKLYLFTEEKKFFSLRSYNILKQLGYILLRYKNYHSTQTMQALHWYRYLYYFISYYVWSFSYYFFQYYYNHNTKKSRSIFFSFCTVSLNVRCVVGDKYQKLRLTSTHTRTAAQK